MGVRDYFFNTAKDNGVINATKSTFQRAGEIIKNIGKSQEQLDTLFYFLNTYVDITKLPKANGSLRILQENDVVLLKLFHEICKKNNLTYWIDYGTLLGSVRHKGFIPWDDDVDVSMPRGDFEKAIKIFDAEFGKYGIVAQENKKEPMSRIGIGYKHLDTGIWIDVFPMDECNCNEPLDKINDKLCKLLLKYRKYYYRNKNRLPLNEIKNKKNEIINMCSDFSNKVYFMAPEFIYFKLVTHEIDEVYPLQLVQFENIELYAPAQLDRYLKRIYGDKYMYFPRSGIEHHGDYLSISSWALRSDTDMNKIKEELCNYVKNYTEES